MEIHCKIWANAKTEEKTLKLLQKVKQKLDEQLADVKIEAYPKINGFVASFVLVTENENWSDAVVETITLAQCVAYDWLVIGTIRDEFSIYSNKTTIPGIVGMEMLLFKVQKAEKEIL